MKDTLHYIVSSIVEKQDAIEISESEENGVLNFIIKVDPSDMGKIIGKGGKVIKAVRNIMKIPAMKNNKKVFISLAENL
ncbi:MAG: KH domain-containing protein [Candidatus Levybacteria bacterium]|nr:KH domain-containing protein [Candidatus Levybacteria bacterium]